MWWSWKKDAIELFRRIDPPRWVESRRNPIAFLAKIPQKRFEQLTEDDGYLAHLNRVKEAYQNLFLDPVNDNKLLFQPGETIAYFSMEFGGLCDLAHCFNKNVPYSPAAHRYISLTTNGTYLKHTENKCDITFYYNKQY